MNVSYQSETELSSVNSILIAIGQAPVTRIYRPDDDRQIPYKHTQKFCGRDVVFTGEQDAKTALKLMQYVNPEVAMVHNILMEVNSDVQNEGWVWNREDHYPLTPEEDGFIYVPENILRMDVYENDVYDSLI